MGDPGQGRLPGLNLSEKILNLPGLTLYLDVYPRARVSDIPPEAFFLSQVIDERAKAHTLNDAINGCLCPLNHLLLTLSFSQLNQEGSPSPVLQEISMISRWGLILRDSPHIFPISYST